VNTTDEIKRGLLAIITAAFPRLRFFGSYPCKVVAQAGNLLDVIPDDPTMPPMQAVPIRYGVPGVEATIAPGARVHVEFAGADPGRPFITVWESASVLELKIDATLLVLNSGVQPIARVGDAVVAGPFAGTITGPGNPTVLG